MQPGSIRSRTCARSTSEARTASTKREGEQFRTTIEKLDLEVPIRDRSCLADELIHPGLVDCATSLVLTRYQGTSAVTINVAHSAWAMVTQPLVCVVDDDESVRESLPDLLRELGFAAKVFASAHEFLASDDVSETRCLLLDVAMPGMSGPQLQRELTLRGIAIPLVFITARVDEVLRQRLIGQGAVECLFKPFSEQQLRVALESALARP